MNQDNQALEQEQEKQVWVKPELTKEEWENTESMLSFFLY
jgi:hypothetical protein